jgi:hypothetical protein
MAARILQLLKSAAKYAAAALSHGAKKVQDVPVLVHLVTQFGAAAA